MSCKRRIVVNLRKFGLGMLVVEMSTAVVVADLKAVPHYYSAAPSVVKG